MPVPEFRAYQVAEPKRPAEIVTLTADDLPESGLLVRVTHSSLNYKDGLALLGRPGVVRSFPMTCGIDLAGEVVETTANFNMGQSVVLTGAGMSETVPGGYSGYQRVDPASVVLTPPILGSRGSMAVGTAGLTAMLCILRLEATGLNPDQGPVLVTGATGGVGSFAVCLLAELGYEVHAATGKASEYEYLTSLGAASVVPRESLTGEPRPLGREVWAAAVDSVGGVTLATVLSQVRYGGSVAACGLAGGFDLPATVMPFILRGVSLLGVDSVLASVELRREAWSRLEDLVSTRMLGQIVAADVSFEDVSSYAQKILNGEVRGRVVVNLEN